MSPLSLPIVPSSLRGGLPEAGLGARGIEKAARNRSCQRLQVATAAGVSLSTLAEAVYGIESREGQSPFAIQAGNRFEQELLDLGGARLFQLYREAGRLSVRESRLEDVPRRIPGTDAAARLARRDFTEDLFRRKLAKDPTAPNVILKPRLAIVLLGEIYEIEPDLLVAAAADPFYRAVEVKSYSDRAGKTDPADIRGACRQAAVGVFGMRQTLARLSVPDPTAIVEARGDLILRKPGRNEPTLSTLSLEQEVGSVERLVADLPAAWSDATSTLAAFGPGVTLDQPGVLDAIPNDYRDTCREFCPLWVACRRQAAAAGDASFLGSQLRDSLAGISLPRAIELRDGTGTAPANPVELALATRLRAADAAYQQVV
jgi:hypothetical protein